MFGAVGVTGLVVNQSALWIATEGMGLHYMWSAILATQCSTAWNFVLAEWLVFRGTRDGRTMRLLMFALVNNSWLALRAPFLFALTEAAGLHYLTSNLIVLISSTLIRFAIADSWIWPSAEKKDTARKRKRRRPCYMYDLHGLIRISSDVRLPELQPFRVGILWDRPDLVVTVAADGFGGLRKAPVVENNDHRLRYVEHLGGFGFGMRIHVGELTEVQVTPLLRFSPHVLYTNVVEPILRWLFVDKGYALVHGACLEINGHGVLITAQTDTGKTTTCLRSLRAHGSRFISDDMVIVSADGMVLSYPKPLTISAHTLKAAMAAELPLWRKAALQIQGRLHSKEGRRVGLNLSKKNLPVATFNALVQMIVPPPKYHVSDLIPEAEVVRSLRIRHVVSIERGEDLTEGIEFERARRLLSENTEDAYGFPPYPLIADALSNGNRSLEDDIRGALLETVKVTRLRTLDRNWFERLPALVGNGNGNIHASATSTIVLDDPPFDLRPASNGHVSAVPAGRQGEQVILPSGAE